MNPSLRSATIPTILALLIVIISATHLAADSRPESPDVTDLAWMAGDWAGGEGDSTIQEQWSVPDSGNMMGMFRLIQGGEVAFYEFMTITRQEATIVLRIKHFGADLVGWEERSESVVFELRALEDRRAVFETEKDGHPERLVFERLGDELVITLEKPDEGSRTSFRYRRQTH